jgi:3-dehydroquinate synthase
MNTATAQHQLQSEFNRDDLSFDIQFDVPQTQRLRFTQNVFENDAPVLSDLIEASGPAPAKVQIWVDGALRVPLGSKVTALHARLNEQLHIEAIPEIKYVTGGEAVKRDPKLIDEMWSSFNEVNLDRRSYVLVIGGGAVLDAVGYAAATAHRGIRLIRIPDRKSVV